MRNALIGMLFGMAFAVATPAAADLSIGFSSGPVSIGINVPTYPRLVAVPGVPVFEVVSVDDVIAGTPGTARVNVTLAPSRA